MGTLAPISHVQISNQGLSTCIRPAAAACTLSGNCYSCSSMFGRSCCVDSLNRYALCEGCLSRPGPRHRRPDKGAHRYTRVMTVYVIMAMRLVVSRHAQHSKEAIQDGALVEVRKAGGARPAEQVACNLENVVLCACLLRLCPMHMLQKTTTQLSIESSRHHRRSPYLCASWQISFRLIGYYRMTARQLWCS